MQDEAIYPAFTRLEWEVLHRALLAYKRTHPSYTVDELLSWLELIECTVVSNRTVEI